jgi:hypothetical protein
MQEISHFLQIQNFNCCFHKALVFILSPEYLLRILWTFLQKYILVKVRVFSVYATLIS